MERRTESSIVHPRNVSDNPLSTDSGTQQAIHNVRQFRPPHSEARPAKLARIVVLQVPAACDYSTSRADLDETNSEDEGYNPEDDTRESKKQVILTKLGKIWRDTRGNLFNKFYDDSKSLAENVEHRCPEGIDKDDWKAFLEYHLEEDTLIISMTELGILYVLL
ncbi:hypothetical protein PIB30_077993 [Stylosanthes scabra]|uniref:Uncharacterized protein n=1 Tax=Stylosanthes scabra TaxID=79078 RepID=A0ABU6RQT7_9FABA|nr:hypothetical protein [Stylosanthes scabra]